MTAREPEIEFQDTTNEVQHWAFQTWRQNHLRAYYLTFQSQSKARLHRMTCWHLGHPNYEGPQSFTRNRKVCDNSIETLLDWARGRELAVRVCEDCMSRSAADLIEHFHTQMPELGRLKDETEEPTLDFDEYQSRARTLFFEANLERPVGTTRPMRATSNSTVFRRDPKVKAWAMKRANGLCESCGDPAPFEDEQGVPFLEVHHLIPLANGGSDTTENTAAVCPNCHRALHHASNRVGMTARIVGLVLEKENKTVIADL